jgi:uncharacterized protein YgiM (DUF1202 family)
MKRRLIALTLFFILLMAGAIPLSSRAMLGFPDQPQSFMQENETDLTGCPISPIQPIYAVPGDEASIMDWLLEGTCVSFDARSSDSQWLRIMASESQVSHPGWVPVSGVTPKSEIEPLLVVEIQAITPYIKGCVIRANSLNIRTGPGTGYFEIGHLLKDECVELTGRSADSYYVRFKRGWLSTLYLQVVNGNLHMLPVVKAGPPEHKYLK